MCFGPGSWMTGWTTGSPQVGSEVKSFVLQVWSVRVEPQPAAVQVPAAATIRPLSGIVKSALRENVENIARCRGRRRSGRRGSCATSNQ